MGKKVTYLFSFFQFRTFGGKKQKMHLFIRVGKGITIKGNLLGISIFATDFLKYWIFLNVLSNWIYYYICKEMYFVLRKKIVTTSLAALLFPKDWIRLTYKKGGIWYWQKKALQYYITERTWTLRKVPEKGKIRSTILWNLIWNTKSTYIDKEFLELISRNIYQIHCVHIKNSLKSTNLDRIQLSHFPL